MVRDTRFGVSPSPRYNTMNAPTAKASEGSPQWGNCFPAYLVPSVLLQIHPARSADISAGISADISADVSAGLSAHMALCHLRVATGYPGDSIE